MIPPEFDYVAPETLADALTALTEGGEDATLDDTLGVALKVREDIDRVRRDRVLEGA